MKAKLFFSCLITCSIFVSNFGISYSSNENTAKQMDMLNIDQGTTREAVNYRHKHLHQGLDKDVSHFKYDDDPTTTHLVHRKDNVIVGIISLINESPLEQKRNPKVWRLRGLCVTKEYRGKGIGSILLKKAAGLAKLKGAHILWGNVREQNVKLFLSKGAKKDSDAFLLSNYPQLGKFYRMKFTL